MPGCRPAVIVEVTGTLRSRAPSSAFTSREDHGKEMGHPFDPAFDMRFWRTADGIDLEGGITRFPNR